MYADDYAFGDPQTFRRVRYDSLPASHCGIGSRFTGELEPIGEGVPSAWPLVLTLADAPMDAAIYAVMRQGQVN